MATFKMERNMIDADNMISYLQFMMNRFEDHQAMFGTEDRTVLKELDALIACKEMAEALIGLPVNLQLDGKVTVG